MWYFSGAYFRESILFAGVLLWYNQFEQLEFGGACDCMKKFNGVKICYGASVLLFIGFIINTIIDYGRYNSTLNSAPFYLWVIVNGICFIVPAIIVLIIGLIIKKKIRKD